MLGSLRGAALALLLVTACGEPPPPAVAMAPPPPATAARAASVAKGGPSAEMPRRLGGIGLGMSLDEFGRACAAKGAKILPTPREDTAMCTLPPEPLQFDGVVVGTFCDPGTTVCEIAYVVYGKRAERDDQIRALVGDLTGRFGAPTGAEGHAESDPGRACAAGASVHFGRTWFLGRGRIRLLFDCAPGDDGQEAPLTLIYDDERAIVVFSKP